MFNEIIVSNFSNPRYAVEVDNATHTIELGNPVCGDRIRVQLLIEDGIIKRAAYAAWGCATSLATGNIFCARVDGISVAAATCVTEDEAQSLLGELDPAQYHCLEMLQALFDKLRALPAQKQAAE